jgi:hypothetical protein
MFASSTWWGRRLCRLIGGHLPDPELELRVELVIGQLVAGVREDEALACLDVVARKKDPDEAKAEILWRVRHAHEGRGRPRRARKT